MVLRVAAGVDAEKLLIEAYRGFFGILEAAFDLDFFNHRIGFKAQQLLGFEDAPVVNMTIAQAAQVHIQIARVLGDQVHFVAAMAHGFKAGDVFRRTRPRITTTKPALGLIHDNDGVVGQFEPLFRVIELVPRRFELFWLQAVDVVEVDGTAFCVGLLIHFLDGVEGLAVAGFAGADVEHGRASLRFDGSAARLAPDLITFAILRPVDALNNEAGEHSGKHDVYRYIDLGQPEDLLNNDP